MSVLRAQALEPEDVLDGVYYPSEDDEPMAESTTHAQAMMEIYSSLEQLFADREDVEFATNMFLYYQEGNPKARRTPDVMVLPGVTRDVHLRSVKTWVLGVPGVIFEVTSSKTRKTDWTTKKALYARLGVKEYFLFDPLHDYLKRKLMGFRLVGRRYVAIKRESDGSLASEVLGAHLHVDGYLVRFFESATRKSIPFRRELIAQADAVGRRADAAERRAEAAERELAQLRAQVRKRGRGNGRQ